MTHASILRSSGGKDLETNLTLLRPSVVFASNTLTFTSSPIHPNLVVLEKLWKPGESYNSIVFFIQAKNC